MPVQLPFQKRWVRWSLAFLFWTLVGLFYSTFGPGGWAESLQRAMSRWYIWGLLAVLIVQVDRRLPVSPDALPRRVLFHIPLSLAFTLIFTCASRLVSALLDGDLQGFSLSPHAIRGTFLWNIPIYWVIIGAYGAYDYYNHLKQRQLETAELERLLAESRLDALRTQLHPHFLFNALNAISAHVERDPRTARRMLEHLGELLRMSLDHSEDQEIPLEQELAFLERYLAIQKVRFEDRLDVRMEVDPEVFHALVPTFVLQPLVENAIRHGVAPRTSKVSIQVVAWREDGRLHLRVQDDGPGLPAGWKITANQGVGLSNTRERLRRLYGESDHSFEIASEPGAGVRVDLSFPFREADEVASG